MQLQSIRTGTLVCEKSECSSTTDSEREIEIEKEKKKRDVERKRGKEKGREIERMRAGTGEREERERKAREGSITEQTQFDLFDQKIEHTQMSTLLKIFRFKFKIFSFNSIIPS